MLMEMEAGAVPAGRQGHAVLAAASKEGDNVVLAAASKEGNTVPAKKKDSKVPKKSTGRCRPLGGVYV